MKCQKVQTLIRRCVEDAAAGLGLHFLHMSQGPFPCDAGQMQVVSDAENFCESFFCIAFNLDLKPTCLKGHQIDFFIVV